MYDYRFMFMCVYGIALPLICCMLTGSCLYVCMLSSAVCSQDHACDCVALLYLSRAVCSQVHAGSFPSTEGASGSRELTESELDSLVMSFQEVQYFVEDLDHAKGTRDGILVYDVGFSAHLKDCCLANTNTLVELNFFHRINVKQTLANMQASCTCEQAELWSLEDLKPACKVFHVCCV